MKAQLLEAIDAALAQDWHRAHHIVQQYEEDAFACWIHAVLHKIEGDEGIAAIGMRARRTALRNTRRRMLS